MIDNNSIGHSVQRQPATNTELTTNTPPQESIVTEIRPTDIENTGAAFGGLPTDDSQCMTAATSCCLISGLFCMSYMTLAWVNVAHVMGSFGAAAALQLPQDIQDDIVLQTAIGNGIVGLPVAGGLTRLLYKEEVAERTVQASTNQSDADISNQGDITTEEYSPRQAVSLKLLMGFAAAGLLNCASNSVGNEALRLTGFDHSSHIDGFAASAIGSAFFYGPVLVFLSLMDYLARNNAYSTEPNSTEPVEANTTELAEVRENNDV